MTRWIALLVLLLTACSADPIADSAETSETAEETELSEPALEPTTGPDWALSLLDQASIAWLDRGVPVPHVPRVVVVPVSEQARLNEVCEYPVDYVGLLGCSRSKDPALAGLWLSEVVETRTSALGIVKHELGHLIRHQGGHIPCDTSPGDALMCDTGSATWEITEADVAFVLGAE